MVPLNAPKEPDRQEQALLALFPVYISADTRKAMMELCIKASSDVTEQKDFAQKLVAYARDFILRYPQIAEALFLGEELGGSTKQQRMHAQAVRDYTGRDVRRGDIWNGAGEHSLTVGMLAEIIAREMGFSDESVRRVALAGGLHDWWKKHEIAHMWDAENQLAAAGIPVSVDTMNTPEVVAGIRAAFDAAKEEDRRGLREIGIPNDIIVLAGSSRLYNRRGPRTDEELIIFFLDHVMAGVRPSDMVKRIQGAVGGNSSYVAYENSFKSQLGGQTSHELMLQSGLGQEIQQRIADRIGYTGNLHTLHEYVTELFIDAVRKSESQI